MKPEFNTRILSSLLLLGLATTFAGAVLADETPRRKTGLWEINMQMDGAPGMGAIQQCIDQKTDNLLHQQKKENSDCSVMDIKYKANKVTLHSVCTFGDTTATTDALFTGSFDAAYTGDIKSSYNPPLHGKSQSQVNIDAKWLSPCKPGQKPGDVIMPNMKSININEMMNDPKLKEMMKRQK